MADWDTADPGYQVNGHSRRSSQSSGHSSSNKENRTLERQYSESTTSSERELILRGGKELTEESRTEITSSFYENHALSRNGDSNPEIPARQPMTHGSGSGTAKERALKSPYSGPGIDSIPEDEITIPNNADISAFSCDQLANFFKCLKIDDRIISHLHRKTVDGKRFSRFKDSELETLGMKNPVVMFFRDRSNNSKSKGKMKQKFVL